jgi:HK97 family phage portal protein
MSYSERYKRAMLEIQRGKAAPTDPYSDEAFGNWVSEIEASLDFHSLKNQYFSENWPYIAVNVVARKISRQPLTIEKESISDGATVSVPAENNSLMRLLDNPNDQEGYANFMYKVASEMTLMGNAIIWNLRFHRELILIPTEIVTIETNSDGSIKYYQVDFGSTLELQNIYQGYMRINPRDVIHMRLPHLNSMYWGLSPFVPARKSMLFDKYTKEFLLNFYLKQANPGPVLEMGELANEKQAMRLLKSIETNWTGRRNQRRTMILPKGVTAKSLQQTMAEQQLKEHLLINRDDIRATLAIPPHELGLQKSGSIGSDETKEQIKNFWEQTVIPFQNIIADTFSNYFKLQLGPKTFFKFDNSDVAALQADESKKADIAIKQMNFMTINEVRKSLYELPPVPGGDIIRGTQQQTPDFFNMPMQQATPQALPPAPQQDEQEELEDERLQEAPRTGTENFLKQNMGWWSSRRSKEDSQLARAERKILKSVLDIFAEEAPITVKLFKSIFKDRFKQNGFFPEEERLRTALNEAYSKFEKQYTEEAVPTLIATGEVGYDLQIDTPFNLPSETEIQALRSRNEQGRREAMEARALRNFQTFSETTTEQILDLVERGIKEAKTLDETAADILSYFGEAAPNRSKTIARTETLTAVSLGQKAAEDDAATVVPGLKKMWITAGDDRVRDSHETLDGVQIPVGSEFTTGDGESMEFPRDPRGSAHNVINCFLPDTKIQTHSLKDVMRSSYEGKIINIFLDESEPLSGTPNHPILTTEGWIPICKLNEGDHVIKASLRKPVKCSDLHIDGMIAEISQLFDSLQNSFGCMRVPGAIVNFHGDVPDSDVDIVNVNGLLRDRLKSLGLENGNEFLFNSSDLGKCFLFGDSGFYKSSGGVCLPHGFIGGSHLLESGRVVHPAPFELFGLGSAALLEAVLGKVPADGNSGKSSNFAYLLDADTFLKVKPQKVRKITVSNYFGHVYNLSTNEGWYTANGIVSSNCRCTWTIVPPDVSIEL